MAVPQNINDIVIRFCIEAKKFFDIDRVLLFGSYANGTANEFSDIDVAVQIKSRTNPDKIEIGKKLWQIASGIDIRIEPKIFFTEDYDPNEPANIHNSIFRNGIDITVN